jgi:membrane-associated phospholipid phosphatase
MMVTTLAGATPAFAESSRAARSCSGVPSVRHLFTGTLADLRGLAMPSTAGLLAAGAIAAASTRPVDNDVTRSFSGANSGQGTFGAGAFIGSTPVQLGTALGTYAVGRLFDKPCAASLGADLVRAELMAEGLTMAIKEATRRSRPEGSGYSFPSGHTTVSFATATVLQQHYGWKVGIPAYAVASYVAASRVEQKRHYLSDVAFGAALGIVAGRTVTVGHGRRLMVTPMASPDGAGASFTWLGKK